MPLVDFNPTALVNGYNADVTKFNVEQSHNLILHTSFENILNIGIVEENIIRILSELKELIKLNITDTEWDDFDYSHDVSKLMESDQLKAKALWGLRHALCYQLLIYTYYKSITPDFIDNDIKSFKLGIFGSVTPTSDIDIGFQYARITDRKVGIIAHVVKIFEDAFLNLTKKYSLGYDIEPYADMMYLDDEQGGLFYCDSTDFDDDDLLKMMPAIGASIIRNVVQSQIDSDPNNYKDVRRYKTQNQEQLNQHGGGAENIKKLVNMFDFENIITYFENLNLTNTKNLSNILSNINNHKDEWIENANEMIIEYMTVIYNESRTTYYEKVKSAEKILAGINLTRGEIVDKLIRLELMIQIAEALVFRAESYVSPSTVMHIVRVMQANELAPEEGCDHLFIKKSKAQCALGKMGYTMSCLEQIGYLYRFNNTYCNKMLLNGDTNTHIDNVKCTKKIDKYLPRLKNGILELNKIRGGRGKRHRRYSKKIFKNGNTRRLKKRSNKNIKYIRSTRHRKRL